MKTKQIIELTHKFSKPHRVADGKKFRLIDALASLDLHYPKVDAAKRKELAEAREALLARPVIAGGGSLRLRESRPLIKCRGFPSSRAGVAKLADAPDLGLRF